MASFFQNFTNPFTKLTELSLNTWIALVCIVLLAGVFLLLRKVKLDTRALVAGALSIAIAFLLSCFRFYSMPQGGSITPASMLPMMLYAWCYGPAAGLAAGIVYGFLQLLQDFYVVHPLQLLMDYVFAFGALGLVGFFRKNLLVGITVAGLVRLVMHTVSGAVFFASYAPEGQNVWLYSLGYNGSVVLPDLAICLVIAAIPTVRATITRLYRPVVKA